MRLLYFAGIAVYRFVIYLASFFNAKAKLWQEGRQNLFGNLEKQFTGNQPTIWFHCASLGEFEQGRPLMEHIRSAYPQYRILLTFFSPSGYEIRKNYTGADVICYMPSDTPGHAKRFLEITKPVAAFFIKYEFWYFHLEALRHKNIPHFLVSGIFRKEQPFFRWYGNWFRKALQGYAGIFTQDNHSLRLVKQINNVHAFFSGDTRFDRVLQLSMQAKEITMAGIFSDGNRVLIAGSSWPPDEEHLVSLLEKETDLKLIIAPHETGEEKILLVINRLQKCKNLQAAGDIVRFSKATEENIKQARVLLIDNVGMLSSLYRYGQIAYIGGGFGAGIHNTLEAAVWGMPVVFGPNFEKFNEAKDLLKTGAAFTFRNSAELEREMDNLLRNPEILKISSEKARDYVKGNAGATAIIIAHLEKTGILKPGT